MLTALSMTIAGLHFHFKKCDNVKIENSRIIENREVMYKRSSDVAMHSNIIKN